MSRYNYFRKPCLMLIFSTFLAFKTYDVGVALEEKPACAVYFVLEADVAGRISRPQDKPPCHQRWRAWPTVLTDC